MPRYDFSCKNNHTQTVSMSFKEHENLPRENDKAYVECDVRNGDVKNPRCTEKAFQVISGTNVGINMNYPGGQRH